MPVMLKAFLIFLEENDCTSITGITESHLENYLHYLSEQPCKTKPGPASGQSNSHQLFISMNGCENIKNSLYHFNQALRKLNPKYKNAAQLRQSVITEWLKEKDLRTVQYMAGHRYVSSTERYQTTNLEDLKEALNKHHPLK